MKWSPEPLGTHARARTRGYRLTFYRGDVTFDVFAVRPWPAVVGLLRPRTDMVAIGWHVHGSLLEELLRGEPRSMSRHRSDHDVGPFVRSRTDF